MRAALPAHFPVASRGAWYVLLAVLCGLATAAVTAWGEWQAEAGRVRLLLPVLAGLLVALLAWRWLARRSATTPQDRLVWDGSTWCLLRPQPETGHLQLIMDGGAWMLLRWQGGQEGGRPRVRWLPLSAADEPAAWHLFRVAVIDQSRHPVDRTRLDSSR